MKNKAFKILLIAFYFINCSSIYARTYKELAQKEIALGLTYVHSASLFKESRLDAPWPTNIIRNQDLKKFGWETLAQALEFLPSFYTVQTSNYKEISLRGVYPINTSNLLFLEDGFRLNSPGFEKFFPFWEYPVENISRIEVVRGAGTSLFGDVSLSGVISITKKRPSPGGQIGFLLGNHNTKTGSIQISHSQWQLLLHYADRNGEKYTAHKKDDLSTIPISHKINNDENPDNYSINFRWQKDNLLFTYELLRFKHSENRGIYGQILLPEDKFAIKPRKEVTQHLLGFLYRFKFKTFNWEFKTYFNRSDDENYHVVSTQREFCFFPPLNYYVDQHTERYGLEIRGKREFYKSIFLWGAKIEQNHYISYKVHYWINPFESPWSCIIPLSSAQKSLPSAKEKNYALYGELKLNPLSWIYLNFGFRFDHFEAFKDKISPRFSLIIKPKSNLSFTLSYAKAFQSPPYIFRTMNNIDISNIDLHNKNFSDFLKCISKNKCKKVFSSVNVNKIIRERKVKKSLSLEESDQFNFSIRYKPSQEFYLAMTAFYQHLDDLIARNDPYNYFQYYNIGEWSEIGLEIESRYEGNILSGFLNYSIYDILENKNWSFVYDNRISGIPKWMFKGGISFKISETPTFYISPTFRYYGPTLYKDKLKRKDLWSSSYFLTDINFLVEKEPWTLTLKFENIFNKGYYKSGTVGPYRQLGRTVWIKVNFSFL